jgi:hypothetical protein
MAQIIRTEASGDCEAAQEAVDKANRELAEADDRYDRADQAFKEDASMQSEEDNLAGFAACLLTSGVLGLELANPVVPLLGGVGCIGYFGYQEWRAYEKTKDDLKALEAADKQRKQAERALKQAQKVREDACHYAGGCGSRGGRGFRRPDGKCAGWDDWGYA